jgi:GNAT superfamily N-acetyltransferase
MAVPEKQSESKVTVRRATLEDKERVFAFVRKAYAGRWQYKIPERWQWEYVNNPYLESADLPVWIAVTETGEVVGQTCALVEPLVLGGQERRVGWSVDTFLFPEYRGQGIGFQLQKANDEGNPIFMSLSMSAQNRKIKAGLGSVAIDPVPGYRRLVRYTPESLRQAALSRYAKHGETVARLLQLTRLDHLAAAFLNLRLRKTQPLSEDSSGIEFKPVERFGEEADQLWAKLSHCFYAVVKRDAQYLNWKYVDQPHTDYARITAWKDGEICGYVIVRRTRPPERDMGIIADVFVDPQDEPGLRSLWLYAVRYFEALQVKDILAATSVQAYQDCLHDLGFNQVKGGYPMFHCKDGSPECVQAREPGAWFLSRGDHDWDQFPLAR